MKYVDRGDAPSPDFTSLIFDGLHHELDLSSIVPPESANHLVHFRVSMRTATGCFIRFYQTVSPTFGEQNYIETLNDPAVQFTNLSGSVLMNENRKIGYSGGCGDTEPEELEFFVRGWWIG